MGLHRWGGFCWHLLWWSGSERAGSPEVSLYTFITLIILMHILKITTHNSHLLEESNDKGISECMVGSPHQSKDYHVTSTFWATTVIPHPEDGNCPPHNLPLLLGTHLELYLPALKLKQGHGQQSANFFIKSGCEYFSLCRAYVASVAINQLHPCSMTIRKPMSVAVYFLKGSRLNLGS